MITKNKLMLDMARVLRQVTNEEAQLIKRILVNNNIYYKCVSYYLNNGIFDVIEKLEPSNLEQIRTYLELCYLK